MTSQPQLATPSGIVTFLFTDVESSTRLWEDHPSQMDAAMARHDEIMRLRIEQHRGYVFSVAGDAFAAAFHTPNEAAQASIAVQQDLAEEPWPEPIRIRVRIGLHTGVAEERGGDYFGPVLNRAARLMSAGHGGQVLVSAATKELLADHGFVDLGERGVADRWWDLAVATWSVTWNFGPGLEDLFLKEYGIERDQARIEYYRLLYDVVS